VRSWRGKHRNEDISDEPCVDRAEVSYLLLETPALLVDELPRIPKRRSSQNDLKANFAEINFYEVRAY
jgi:hypothetical protein